MHSSHRAYYILHDVDADTYSQHLIRADANIDLRYFFQPITLSPNDLSLHGPGPLDRSVIAGMLSDGTRAYLVEYRNARPLSSILMSPLSDCSARVKSALLFLTKSTNLNPQRARFNKPLTQYETTPGAVLQLSAGKIKLPNTMTKAISYAKEMPLPDFVKRVNQYVPLKLRKLVVWLIKQQMKSILIQKAAGLTFKAYSRIQQNNLNKKAEDLLTKKFNTNATVKEKNECSIANELLHERCDPQYGGKILTKQNGKLAQYLPCNVYATDDVNLVTKECTSCYTFLVEIEFSWMLKPLKESMNLDFIPEIYDAYVCRPTLNNKKTTYGYVTEKLDEKLSEYIKKDLSDDQCQNIALQLRDIFEKLDEIGVTHRNCNFNNFMLKLTENQVPKVYIINFEYCWFHPNDLIQCEFTTEYPHEDLWDMFSEQLAQLKLPRDTPYNYMNFLCKTITKPMTKTGFKILQFLNKNTYKS